MLKLSDPVAEAGLFARQKTSVNFLLKAPGPLPEKDIEEPADCPFASNTKRQKTQGIKVRVDKPLNSHAIICTNF